MEKRLLNVKETAEYLGIGLTKCRELLRGKNGIAIQIGNRWYADKPSLDEWVEKNSFQISENAEEFYKKLCDDIDIANDIKTKVYVISDGEYVKIGITKNIKERMNGINTNNPRKLTLIACQEYDNAYEIEQSLHEKFKDKQIMGEWFDMLDEVREIKTVDELIMR